MRYLDENKCDTIYKADIGKIIKIKNTNPDLNGKLAYVEESTSNGYCYKDCKTFENNPNGVCYIAECLFNNAFFVDYVNKNKVKLIEEGGLATRNSIKDEIRNLLEYDEYYYEYKKDGKIYTIEAKKFDDELIDIMAQEVFDNVDWQTTQDYIFEHNWIEDINYYYKNKVNKEENKGYGF